VSGTADALDRALSMSQQERRERTDRLAEVSVRLPPSDWLAAQVDALD
jgi:trehalose 6-phosphate synthase